MALVGVNELYVYGIGQGRSTRINPYKVIGLLTIALSAALTTLLIALLAPVAVKVVLTAALALA